MMGDVTGLVAREFAADKLRAAPERRARVPVSSAGTASLRRQRSRVLESLVLVPRLRQSTAREAE